MPSLVELAYHVDALHERALRELDQCAGLLPADTTRTLGHALASFPPTDEDVQVVCQVAGLIAALCDEDGTHPRGPGGEALGSLSAALHDLADGHTRLAETATGGRSERDVLAAEELRAARAGRGARDAR